MGKAAPVEDPQGMMGIMPHGTVTAWGDRDSSKIYLFCEQDPHPDDWAMALEIAGQYSDGQPPEEYMDEGTVVFEFHMGGMEPDLAAIQSTGGGERGKRRLSLLAALRGMFYEPQHRAIGNTDVLGASPWSDDSHVVTL